MIGRMFTVGGLTLLSRLTGFARDIILAAVLGADACEIYTDVDGVYTADPNICP